MVSDRSKVDVSNVEPTVCWVVALESEAKPIISYFELDHQSGNNIFPIYRNDKLGHSLIISGVGQINAAAATTYLASESDAPPWAAWINLGIAGSMDGEIGKLYQGIKVINPTKEKVFFPGCIAATFLFLAGASMTYFFILPHVGCSPNIIDS